MRFLRRTRTAMLIVSLFAAGCSADEEATSTEPLVSAEVQTVDDPGAGEKDDESINNEALTSDTCDVLETEELVISCSLDLVRDQAQAAGVDVDALQAGIADGTFSKNDADATLSLAGVDAGDLAGFRAEVSSTTRCNEEPDEVHQLRCILPEALPGTVDEDDHEFIIVSYEQGVFSKVDIAFMIQESRNEPTGRDVRYRDYDFFEGVEITDHVSLDDG